MSRVIWRDTARQELREVVDYLARFSPAAAGRFVEAAEASVELLRTMPELGGPWLVRRAELAGVRTWRPKRFKNYVFFYRPTADGIEILHVTQGARDLDRLLE